MVNYLDLRELRERLEELDQEKSELEEKIQEIKAEIETVPDDEDPEELEEELEAAETELEEWVFTYEDERKEIEELFESVGDEATVLISEDDFKEYAQDLARDIGGNTSGWPYDYIDREQAAEALQMDYSSVDFQGTTYYYQE